MMQRVLGIETSCDETAVAIYDASVGIVANQLYTQATLHTAYGGVVPELAARDHSQRLLPMVMEALTEAKCDTHDLDGIAFTTGPGLIGALFVGSAFGRTLAYGLGIPAIAVHHMEGHLLAPLLTEPELQCPFVALLVSGGHTLLVYVKCIGSYEILGETMDDAVGEAFDKTAKLLGLPYPGGPELSALAQKGELGRFSLTHPMLNRPGCDFSFSGLKTQVATLIKQQPELTEQIKADIAAAFEEIATETLLKKTERALKQAKCRHLIVAGGVSANQRLRRKFLQWCKNENIEIAFPALDYCTDNAAMIAYAGYLRLRAGENEPLIIKPRARWPLTELKPITPVINAG